MTKIALIPLDERPVNTRYPRMIADIAGIDFAMPPPEILSDLRTQSNREHLVEWIDGKATDVDLLIVSIEQLIYGGLIASRITDETSFILSTYLNALMTIKSHHPDLSIFAFSVITRISNANNNIEEPLYWDEYGTRLYRYSQLMHQQHNGADVQMPLDELMAQIPPEHIRDFTFRRLRNHQMNLQLLEHFGHGLFNLLVISSDDTSEYGYGSQEKAWLKTWVQRLYANDDRLMMYPGADEIGCVLLMRAALQGETPLFYVHYAIDADKERIAPYEDGAIRITVERQIRALGGEITEDIAQAEFIVAVNPPSRIGQEYDPETEFFAEEHERRQPFIEQFARDIDAWINNEKRVILCDVAYPNGSDPMLIEQLLAQVDITKLAAYGAWNTAGNTIGTALAQGVASAWAANKNEFAAQQRFLLHRFIEDWAYQHVVREDVRNWLEATYGQRDPTPDQIPETIAQIETRLQALMLQLGTLSEGYILLNVRLPWGRTFEIDFDLVKTDD